MPIDQKKVSFLNLLQQAVHHFCSLKIFKDRKSGKDNYRIIGYISYRVIGCMLNDFKVVLKKQRTSGDWEELMKLLWIGGPSEVEVFK